MLGHLYVVRPFLILLGVASAVVLASKALGLPYSEDVRTAIATADDAIGALVWPMERVVVAVTAWIQGQGVIFNVADHWKHAFILLWLLYVAVWGFWAPPETVAGAATQWAVSGLMALVAGVLFATAPLDSRDIFTWPGIGGSLILTVRLWTGGFRMLAVYEWLAAPLLLLIIYLVAAPPDPTFRYGPSLPTVWPGDQEFFASFSNEAFARLAFGIMLSGASMVLYGALDVHAEGDTLVQKFLNSRMTRLGLNILLVTVGATAVLAIARLA